MRWTLVLAILAACGSGTTSSSSDGGDHEQADAAPAGTRGVTDPVVVFDGTETELGTQYGVYDQSEGGSIDFVEDPLGQLGQVIRFVKPKDADWAHVMLRLTDKRTGYQEPAQVTEWETSYHYHQKMLVDDDPQYTTSFMNLLEDFHCEPCEANNLQLYSGYLDDDSLCLWVAYSTDPTFDPRGLARGSDFDPWPTLTANRVQLTVGADGYPASPPTLPPTGSLVICRPDLHVSDLLGRWVDVELLVKSSSYDSGQIKVWIDGKPFFFDGPNSYRWNQVSDDALPVNTFQWGLYGGAVDAQGPSAWVLYATPPRLELGGDIVYTP
jgi:hypothetical protein